MTLIVEKLKQYKTYVDLEKRFSYDFNNSTKLFSEIEKNELDNASNTFKRNIKLKELIKVKANGSYDLTDLNFWIVNNWGGIRTFKRNDKNEEKIKKFSTQLSISKLTKDTFNTISSLSKISSFIDPDNYVIYDSRVIYAINWIIMTSRHGDIRYFPMPTGRNKKILDFDINTIIHLKHLDKYQNGQLFYNHQIAYFEFCNLIKILSKAVFDDQTIKPYYLEMLLFTIADNEIFNELKSHTKIKIKPNR